MNTQSGLPLAIGFLIGVFGATGHGSQVWASSLSYEQTQDRAEFVLLLRKARQGDAESQWKAAVTYLRLGATSMALPLLASAAASGHAVASSQLGALYEDGRGVEKSLATALEWYLKAGKQGDPMALAAAARLLPKDDPRAAEFRFRSAEAGNADAQYAHALELAAHADEKSLAESHSWFLKAAGQGHLGGQIAVGKQFIEGQVVKQDATLGMSWLQRAARTGDPVANFMVGRIYLSKAESASQALKPLKVAAEAGHRESAYLYGTLLADSKDQSGKREAVKWLEQAVSANHIAAMNRLGELLREAVDGLQQSKRARELFFQAAEKGNIDAMYNFAEMQHSGIGGERDTFQALVWYGKAADGKHERAIQVVESLLNSSIKTSSLGLKGFWQ